MEQEPPKEFQWPDGTDITPPPLESVTDYYKTFSNSRAKKSKILHFTFKSLGNADFCFEMEVDGGSHIESEPEFGMTMEQFMMDSYQPTTPFPENAPVAEPVYDPGFGNNSISGIGNSLYSTANLSFQLPSPTFPQTHFPRRSLKRRRPI